MRRVYKTNLQVTWRIRCQYSTIKWRSTYSCSRRAWERGYQYSTIKWSSEELVPFTYRIQQVYRDFHIGYLKSVYTCVRFPFLLRTLRPPLSMFHTLHCTASWDNHKSFCGVVDATLHKFLQTTNHVSIKSTRTGTITSKTVMLLQQATGYT